MVMIFDGLTKAMRQPQRIASVDYWRGLAILSVVAFHFNMLPYGFLGVNLFFVISGLLVSQRLLDTYSRGNRVRVKTFLIERGFKIWPSYYFFLFAGLALSFFLYRSTHPDQMISFSHLYRYSFFILNYQATDHYIFDHLWSICVEEHFYLFLPVLFVVVQKSSSSNHLMKLFVAIVTTIVFGNCARFLSYKIGFETFNATHNRIDALVWGVLLAMMIRTERFRILLGHRLVFLGGLVLLAAAIWFERYGQNQFYNNVLFHGLTPICFFLILAGSYGLKARLLLPLRWLSYYGYNYYLWHMILLYWVRESFGEGITGLLVFATSGLLLGMAATIFIEEKGLILRRKVLGH